jgi:5-methylcytosine-specific restriction protein A
MFVIGRDYSRRSDIHGRFGGQTQGGISTPADEPFIFLFTGRTGGQYGYEDGWRDEDVFVYTGEGQVGDMEFRAGNRAIRDHAKDGKELLLFEALGKGRPVRFLGKFACPTWEYSRGPDREGNDRTTIRFHLVRTALEAGEAEAESLPPAEQPALAELRRRAYEAVKATQSVRVKEARQVLYERSRAVRDYVLGRANGHCELTGEPAPFRTKSGAPYLEVHHTRRLSDDGPDDPRWVAAITPTAHREIHYGESGDELNRLLQEKLKLIEQD